MEIIDSHQHFWKLGAFPYDWLTPQSGVLYHDFLPIGFADVLRSNDVHQSVAVQASLSTEETNWMLQLAEENKYIAGVVGWIDLLATDFEEQLQEIVKDRKLVGLRHLVQDEPDPEWLLQSRVVKSIRLLAKYDLTYDILIFPSHLKSAGRLAAECPETRLVIDHLAKPAIKSGEIKEWKTRLKKLTAYPNVYCKLSGLVTEADVDNWNADDLRPYVDAALELFGPKRILFGSDYPVCLLAASYSQVLDAYKGLVSHLSDNEVQDIFASNARLFYKLRGNE